MLVNFSFKDDSSLFSSVVFIQLFCQDDCGSRNNFREDIDEHPIAADVKLPQDKDTFVLEVG